MDLHYRLLNVFGIAGDPFSGNPLCVFEDADTLSDGQMQAWARQFNLSETAFVTALRPEQREADVRIFTATYEMPFAGHPALGTAHVVAEMSGGLDCVALSMPAGLIPLRRVDGGWQLRANAATIRDVGASRSDLATTLGLEAWAVVAGGSSWVDAGVEQLTLQLRDADAVRTCAPDLTGMHAHMSAPGRPPHVYVWAWTGETAIQARLFAASGGTLDEDPATGSAAANLGGWLVEQGRRNIEVVISQGAQVDRPSLLVVTIDDAGTVFVGGRVTDVGTGVVRMARS